MARILLVDDEETLLASLTYSLRRAGHEVTCADDGVAALQRLQEQPVDILLLDLMLPKLDGVELCRLLRRTSDVPIIMLTARGEVTDKVEGLASGADDYVTKPFSTQELLARIEAVLRRKLPVGGGVHAAVGAASKPVGSGAAVPAPAGMGVAPAPPGSAVQPPPLPVRTVGVLAAGALRLDLDRHELSVSGETVGLAPKEFQLLQTLMSYQGRVLTRGELIATVWGDDFMGGAKTLDVHMRWLRAKIEPDPAQSTRIITIRGVGFRFE